MSYSFNVRGATVPLAVAAIAPKFSEVISNQPVHAKDRDAAVAAAEALTGLLADPADGQEVSVNVSGWLQWRSGDGADVPYEFTGGSLNVQASFVATAKPE